jgi:cytochrome c oxidase subunit 2
VEPRLVLWILAVLVMAWTAAWVLVLVRSRPVSAFETIEPAENRLRRWLLLTFSVISLVVFALTLRSYPYAPFRIHALGAPADTIEVTAMQWAWSLSKNELPVHVPLAFVVTSRDVNHGFAIYGPSGTLVAQVQAMPGYTNRLVYRFDHPGTYTVRCLEYCGISHHVMLTTFTVR